MLVHLYQYVASLSLGIALHPCFDHVCYHVWDKL